MDGRYDSRRYDSTHLVRRSAPNGWPRFSTSALSSPDGRWALVSTSLTAIVAGTIAWLAMGTLPPANSKIDGVREHGLLPYQLFQQLAHPAGITYAGLGPSGAGEQNSGRRAQGLPQASLDDAFAADQASDNANPLPGIETHSITLDKGDTLVGALEDAGAAQADANGAVAALGRVYNLRNLRAGQTFELSFQAGQQILETPDAAGTVDSINLGGDDSSNFDSNGAFVEAQGTTAGRLLSVTFSPSVEHQVTIARAVDGNFSANDAVKKLVAHVHRAGATIDSSLYLAAMQAGIPADVVVEMIHMFSYKVDFQRDLKPGDSFEVFYDYYYTTDGQPAKEGQISYAVMRLGSREIALYRYQGDPNEPPDYFDAHGQSAKGMLMKTPVDGARITSGFGMRFHPILGYTRMHKGIDFGVPIGTPVMSAGAGTIAFMGVQHGYGNFVLVNHGNGYSTAYGHLSRFAPGLHRGSHVRQGQVIASSGMTGMATGPHLHYEIRVNNVQVNPVQVKIAQGRKLMGRDLRDFLGQRLQVDSQIASMPLETKLADAGSDLRQAKAK